MGENVYAGIESVIDAYAKISVLVGGTGSGGLTKMVNPVCIAGLIQGLSEAWTSAVVLAPTWIGCVGHRGGASGSWQMANRAGTMLDGHFDHGFALDWMRKDLGIVFDEAERIDATLPVTALVDQLYARLQREGHGRWDTSSLIECSATTERGSARAPSGTGRWSRQGLQAVGSGPATVVRLSSRRWPA
ncbi:MAG: hypothetical protein Ct9H300mP12_16090 [Acidimicrobiales bacterium]|nr:MAG: hypothetical protein Ct9H300mP12_16090 [Acidimicrobiales bacterium]